MVIDHINSKKTDNRLENLQIVTTRYNSSKDKSGTSKYTGVSWDITRGKWKADIKINGKSKKLGMFTDEGEAGLAYQRALAKIQNEKTLLNNSTR